MLGAGSATGGAGAGGGGAAGREYVTDGRAGDGETRAVGVTRVHSASSNSPPPMSTTNLTARRRPVDRCDDGMFGGSLSASEPLLSDTCDTPDRVATSRTHDGPLRTP